VDDVYSAIDYVTTLPYVDDERIGVAGICAGGGYAAKASAIDRRVKAVATASAVNTGASARKGWEGAGSTADLMAALDAVAKQRTAEAAGADAAYAPYVPQVGDRTAPRDLQEAADYYLTPRAQHPNAQNKMLFNAFGAWVGFDAFDVVTLLTHSRCS
jgi:dienelactone hydrolase